jgi:hypothetical protein
VVILLYDLGLFCLMLIKGWQLCAFFVVVYEHPSILLACVDKAATIRKAQLSLFNSVFRDGAFKLRLSLCELRHWLIDAFRVRLLFVHFWYAATH